MYRIGRTAVLWVTCTVLLASVFRIPEIAAQVTQSGKSPTLACDIGRHGSRAQRQVTIAEFQRLGCLPTFQYFQALDALPNLEYAAFRKGLKWEFQKTITSEGGVTSGEESFDATPGVKVIRRYSPSDVTVTVQNTSDVAIFVEGYDVPAKKCAECETGAYIAVAPHSSRWIYKIQAFVAKPIWQSSEMRISIINAK